MLSTADSSRQHKTKSAYASSHATQEDARAQESNSISLVRVCLVDRLSLVVSLPGHVPQESNSTTQEEASSLKRMASQGKPCAAWGGITGTRQVPASASTRG